MKIYKSLLYFLILYIPLEEFILKWIPVSDQIFELLYNFTDVLILGIFAIFVYIKNGKIPYNKQLTIISTFLLLSFISYLLTPYSFFNFFIKSWVLIRYILVAYTLYYLYIDRNSQIKIISLIKFSFALQILIGLLQLTGIEAITNFFIPRQVSDSISNWYIKGDNDIPGTFAFPVLYGYFILTSFIIIISTGKFKNYYYVLLILAVTFSFLSGSNIVILLITSYTLLYFYNFKSKVFYYWCSLLFVLVLFNWGFIVDLYRDINSVFGMFSMEYLEASSRAARVGIFRTVPLLFDASLKEIFIGFSYNGDELSKFLLKYYHTLPHVLRNDVMIGLEDVYWIAFLYYHGIFGLTLFIVFLYSIYKKVYRKLKNNLVVSFSIRFLFIAVLLSGFVNQSLYIKSFSFYLWLYIVIAIKLYGRKPKSNLQVETIK